MKSDNIYNAPNPKDKPLAWNSKSSFADTAHEVTRDEREAQFAARQALIEQTRKALNECC